MTIHNAHNAWIRADAPGRVNLLGEHTDYNDGYVLPTTIEQRTTVAVRRSAHTCHTLHSDQMDRHVRFKLDKAPTAQFAKYVYGCFVEATKSAVSIPWLDIEVRSEVPMGVGLSSSAALEVATLRALRTLLDAPWCDVEIARMAQRAEVEHAGVHCGIMDQMASSLASTQSALFLDTRTLERRHVPLPAGSCILVLDSGVPRALAESGYNERRRECEAAARQLGVPTLRDVVDASVLETLAQPLRSRAHHIISENARVLDALVCAQDAPRLGALMNASHASLRDDYAVSIEPLDCLVALLQAHPAVYGAKLTGAGFGGACVALCESGELPDVVRDTLDAYAKVGGHGRLLVPAMAVQRWD